MSFINLRRASSTGRRPERGGTVYRILSLLSLFSLVIYFLVPKKVNAHVKWFSTYDSSENPISIKEVISIPGYWPVFVISAVFIYFMVYADTKMDFLNRYIKISRYQKLKQLPEDFVYRSFIQTLVIFFSSVWAMGGIVLTPELEHESVYVAGIQILILVSLMTKSTAKYAGFGIFALWLYGVKEYGLFHLADYMIFLGIAVFMIIGGDRRQNKVSSVAFFILYLSISWTLQWASVEKWVYPGWSYPLLEQKPYLTLGFSKEIFMVMAGFVEFTLAFLLIALTGACFVVTAIALALVFILAIVDFGKVDAIGHIAIIIALFLMAIKGPCHLNYWFASLDVDPSRRALKILCLYFVALIFFTTIYYGLQYGYNNYLNFH